MQRIPQVRCPYCDQNLPNIWEAMGHVNQAHPEGKLVNGADTAAWGREGVFIYIPAVIAQESTFPFKENDTLILKIDTENECLIIKKRNREIRTDIQGTQNTVPQNTATQNEQGQNAITQKKAVQNKVIRNKRSFIPDVDKPSMSPENETEKTTASGQDHADAQENRIKPLKDERKKLENLYNKLKEKHEAHSISKELYNELEQKYSRQILSIKNRIDEEQVLLELEKASG